LSGILQYKYRSYHTPPPSENVWSFAVQISTMTGMKAVTNISVEI
jgi:hypothetical protein